MEIDVVNFLSTRSAFSIRMLLTIGSALVNGIFQLFPFGKAIGTKKLVAIGNDNNRFTIELEN